MIRVVAVDDSPTLLHYLTDILKHDSNIQVVDTAVNGFEAMEAVLRHKPDVVTMDIIMPGMDGIEAIEAIMSSVPVPIVVVSATCEPGEVTSSFAALEAGAVAVLPKPAARQSAQFEDYRKLLIRTVTLMSGVRVVGRRRSSSKPKPSLVRSEETNRKTTAVVAIGASTGGPPVLGDILESLKKPPPFPILVVQHICDGFVDGLGNWLAKKTTLKVIVPREEEQAMNGTVYLAPDGCQMGITRGGRLTLSNAPPRRGHRPSVGYLFESIRESYGSASVAILLTGMGDDGAPEMAKLRRIGATTISQSGDTCVVNGMPEQAIRLGGAKYILAPTGIADTLNAISEIGTKGRKS